MTETTASQPLPTPEQTSMAQQGKRRAAHGAPLFLSGLLCSFPLTSCPNLAVSESSNEIGWAEVMAFSELAAQSRAKVAELDKPATAEELVYEMMNRNNRKPKAANHGKRPCSRWRRRRKTYGINPDGSKK